MNSVVLFKPRKELDAELNVQAFVALCRETLSVFGADLPFDDHVWDVTAALGIKAKRSASRVVFSSWTTAARHTAPSPMPEPFLSFAKAYFRYQHSLKPTKSIGCRIAALRALCAALLETQGDCVPSSVDASTFNRASQLVNEAFEPAVAYRVAGQLDMVANFMDDNHLAALPLQWRNPLRRPKDSVRVGKEFDEQRQKKLPSPFALDALARAFRAATDPSDVVITSIAAILCSAPDRVNEVLNLREACEVRQKQPNGDPAYGLRFWPSKGADPMVKWLIPSMGSVVEEALARLRMHTEEARKVAAWYEANPRRLFLPAHLEYLRGHEELVLSELGEVLFASPTATSTVREWCKSRKVEVLRRDRQSCVSFNAIERAVIAMLPRGFPVMDSESNLRYSEALCVIRRNELHDGRGTYRCAIDFVDHGVIHTGLGGRSEHGFRSVFDRLEFFEPDGSPIRIRTHQFRHYLNTLAQAGGMSQLDIAKWSGRNDVRQNEVYDHMSDRDKLALMRESVSEDGEPSSAVTTQRPMNLVTRAEFAVLKAEAAHTTDYGYCKHDFAMSPCQLHLDCINCNELACVKGDQVREANIRRLQQETRELLAAASAAEADEAFGATQWVKHQTLTLRRVDELCRILDDPRTPLGAVIHLSHVQPASRLEQAAAARMALRIGDADNDSQTKSAALGVALRASNGGVH